MLIRPQEYIGGDFSPIKKKIDAAYNANQSIWQVFWTEATLDTRLEAGDTSLMAEINTNLTRNGSGSYYFNRVRPLLSMVSGRQIDNRKSTIVVPLENGDQETADQWSKILLHIYKKEHVYQKISQAFHQGACISGMNLLQAYIDFSDDPIFGDIKLKNLPYNQFFIDPYFREKDLSDCNFVWVRSYLTHAAAAHLMPEYYDAIMALPGNPTGTGRDGRFQYMPESYGQTQSNMLAYDEFYYRDFRKRKIVIDKKTGAWREITQEELDSIDFERFKLENPQIELQDQVVPTVRLAIMIQDKVFYDGQNPFGIDSYPFVPVIGYYNPMMPYFYSRIQGIARSLRDPQMLLNRRIVLSADMLESQVNSGFIFKENAVIDVKHLFQTGQGRIIPLKAEAQMTDVQPILPPQIPPSFFELQETFSKELNMVSGITEENMGHIVDENASGFKTAIRQTAGFVTLKPLFENLDDSQNMLGDIIMEMVRANYGPVKIQQILEGAEPQPQFFNKAFGKYHCMVQDGFDTQSQKQMQFAQLAYLREMGVQIPDRNMIEAATIQNKTKLTQQMEQASMAQQQMQQMQMQMQMQQAQAQTELTKARAVADKGLGLERVSRVAENHALAEERVAAAKKDEEDALLSFVKAVKELQGIDIAQLKQVVEIQSALKAIHKAESPATPAQAPMVG